MQVTTPFRGDTELVVVSVCDTNELTSEALKSWTSPWGWTRSTTTSPRPDVVLVIGAHDTVNPALEVWNAWHVIVFKRSMAPGYAGVQNPLFVRDNSQMLFGDAKQRIDEILSVL
jgi:hypothetical protein